MSAVRTILLSLDGVDTFHASCGRYTHRRFPKAYRNNICTVCELREWLESFDGNPASVLYTEVSRAGHVCEAGSEVLVNRNGHESHVVCKNNPTFFVRPHAGSKEIFSVCLSHAGVIDGILN